MRIIFEEFKGFFPIVKCFELNLYVGSRLHIEEYRNNSFQKVNLCNVRQNLGTLSLVKGVLLCGSKDIMHYHGNTVSDSTLNEKGDNSISFLTNLFPVISHFCQGPIKLHYHAFSLLQSWYKKLVISLSDDKQLILPRKNCGTDIFDTTLNLVFLNWDSPVEDVPVIVGDVFKLLLESWNIIVKKDRGNIGRDIPSEVLEKLMKKPWYIKGKYRIFVAVLPYLNDEQVSY